MGKGWEMLGGGEEGSVHLDLLLLNSVIVPVANVVCSFTVFRPSDMMLG